RAARGTARRARAARTARTSARPATAGRPGTPRTAHRPLARAGARTRGTRAGRGGRAGAGARPAPCRGYRHSARRECHNFAPASPVDRLAEQIMTMHMVQHLLLLDLAPVLCLVGLTRVLMRPLTRHTMRLERGLGPFAHPAFAAIFYVTTMWFWHVPALYDA